MKASSRLVFVGYVLSCLVLVTSQRGIGSQAVLKDGDLEQAGKEPQKVKQVAIVGAGAAGASSAYHLRKYADEAGIPIDLTVLDQNDYIGGRSTTICAFENDTRDNTSATASTHPCQPVELGASIFVSVNHILVDAVKEYGLSIDSSDPSDDGEEDEDQTLGVYDGEGFVFTQSRGDGKISEWWNTVKILWKYGISPIRTQKLMKATVGKFLKMYEKPVFPWKDGLTQAAMDVDLLDTTAVTGSKLLEHNNIAERFSHEIIQASSRVNYAQNLDRIHGLETMVCMATDGPRDSVSSAISFKQANSDPGAMSVKDGNWQIFASMLNASQADVYLKSKVDEIEIGDPDKQERLKLKASGNAYSTSSSDYGLDALIIAAPYHQTGIQFTPTPKHVPDDIEYVTLHVTLFSSPHKLSPMAFNMTADEKIPDIILTTTPSSSSSAGGGGDSSNPTGPPFFSISRIRTIKNPAYNPPRAENVYKIFSPAPITASFLRHLLGLPPSTSHAGSTSSMDAEEPSREDITWHHTKRWLSYPYLHPRVTFEPQRLDERLWYTAGVEGFVSTMETSALMGRNVGRLVVDGWLGGGEGGERDSKAAVEGAAGEGV